MAPQGSVTTRPTRSAPNKLNKSKLSKSTPLKSTLLEPTNLDGTVRLHITPLTPTLFPTLVPRSLFPSDTTNYPPPISYHTLEALPYKSYGYVDLLPQLAQKLTTRLNGTVFRGIKVSVQKAKPRTWIPQSETSTGPNTNQSTTIERYIDLVEGRVPEKKKHKREDGVHPGIELPGGRWVKRAWTKVSITGTMGKSKSKTNRGGKMKEDMKKGSLLFQTTLPPTISPPVVTDPKAFKKLEKKRKWAIAAAEAAADSVSSSSDNEGSANEKQKKNRKKVKKDSTVKPLRNKTTIKEFTSNTKFPAFLKASQLDPENKRGRVTQFVEGVGWVDGKGQVVDNSAIKKAVEKRRYFGGAESDDVQAKLQKGTVGRERQPMEDMKRRSSNDDDWEMRDAGSDSDSDSSASELKSKSEPNPAEEAHSKGKTMEESPELVGNEQCGSSKLEESNSDPQSDEDTENEYEHVGETDTEKLSKIRKSHESLRNPDNCSMSSSPQVESDSIGESESEDEVPSSDESSSVSEQEDDSESEHEEEGETQEEQGLKPKPTTSKVPSLKLSIPKEIISESNKPHPLEILFKPISTTVDAGSSGGGLFNFGFADDENDNGDGAPETFEAPHSRPYRSAAPTPDTAVVSKTIKWPDLTRISSVEPTSPIVPRRLSFQQAPATVSGEIDVPLLFQGNVDSAYLCGLSIWSGGHLPEAKSITELPPDEEEQVAEPEAPKMKKRKGNANVVAIRKHKERKIGQGTAVANRAETRKKIWTERFFRYRGEWNREWKNKKREAGKLARRKKRERGIGAGGGSA